MAARRWEKLADQLRPLSGEFLWFGIKQAWACLFGAAMLLALLLSHVYYPDIALSRYDFLFCYALFIQIALLTLKLESLREFGVVILFHLMATIMELFKTADQIGSWSYPEDSLIRIMNVPLFAGFLYSAVGSYMARSWRVFYLRFESFPPLPAAGIIALLAYLNFFTHHFWVDIRYALLIAIFLLFRKTRVYYRVLTQERQMPLLLGFLLITFFIWIAENLGTYARAWIYPDQAAGWKFVSFGKFTSWFLLMQLSFVLIYALRQVQPPESNTHV